MGPPSRDSFVVRFFCRAICFQTFSTPVVKLSGEPIVIRQSIEASRTVIGDWGVSPASQAPFYHICLAMSHFLAIPATKSDWVDHLDTYRVG